MVVAVTRGVAVLAQDGAAKVQVDGVVVEQEDGHARRADEFEAGRRWVARSPLEFRCGEAFSVTLRPGEIRAAPSYSFFWAESFFRSSRMISGRRWKIGDRAQPLAVVDGRVAADGGAGSNDRRDSGLRGGDGAVADGADGRRRRPARPG